MFIFNKIKIGKRFFIVFSLIIVITSSGLFYLMYNMTDQKHEVDSIYKVRFIGIENLIEADRDAYQSSIAISHAFNDYFSARNSQQKKLNEHVKSIKENLLQINDRFAKFSSLYLESGAKRVPEFETMQEHYKKLSDHTRTIEKLLIANQFSTALNLYQNQYAREFNTVRNAMDSLTGISLSLMESEYNRYNAVFKVNMIISFFVAGLTVIFLLVSGFILTRTITVPIRQGISFSQSIAKGDFTKRIELDRKDEFGELLGALNLAVDDLEKLILDIKMSAVQLVEAIAQISEGNQNLSQRTTEQASSLEEVASTIEEAAATIKQNADNASSADNLAKSTMLLAQDGNTVVNKAVESINEINKSSTKIEEIISLINEISFQTNLLALNAAVEAARAGEQGRGFAVVAGEVRNLSQRSASAAKDISNLIEESMGKIESGTSMANKSGDALKEIVASMEKLAEIISELSVASSQQRQGMEQINTVLTEMDGITQHNASLVEEIASASENLTTQAHDLQGMVEKFKIRDTDLIEHDKL